MSNNLVKKVTASVAALSIAMTIVSPVVGVKANDASVEAANRLAALGVIVDNAANPSAYNLDGSITRREMLKVMMNLSTVEVMDSCEGSFKDLSSSDWGCKYAEAALKAGFIAANDNFRPNDLVSKSEALKMVMQAKGIAAKEGVTPWQKGYVDSAVEAGVLTIAFTDYTTVAKRSMVVVTADTAVTASNVAVDSEDEDMINIDDILGGIDLGEGNEADSNENETPVDNTTDTTDNTNANNNNNNNNSNNGDTTSVANGDLELSLNPASPAFGSQIPNVGVIRFAKVDFTAGSADVSLNSVELKKVGLGQVDSSTRVYFEKNGNRVSSGRTSFTTDGNAIISFVPAYVIKAGSTETLDLYVELNENGSGTDYEFVSGKVVASANNVTGSFSTPRLRTANYEVTRAIVTKAGSGNNYKANSDLIELGAFRVEARNPKTEQTDLAFQSITLNAVSSANLSNLADIQLVRNDVKVSTETMVNGRDLTFNVNDIIKEGTSAIYYIKARVVTVEDSEDDYEFRLRNASDLNIIETKNAFRALVDNDSDSSNSFSTVELNKYTVQGGEIRFDRDSSVALSKSYAPGTSEVVLMQGKVTAKNSVRLEDIALTFASKNSTNVDVALSDFFSTVNLTVGGTTFTSSAPSASTTKTINFDGTVIINGTADVKLYATLKSNAPVGSVKFDELKLDSFTDKEFLSNDETVTSGVGTIPGVNVTVETSTLNVTRNDALGNTNLAAGSKGVTLYGVRLSSSKGNPINVTSATFDFTNSVNTKHRDNVYATLYVNGQAVSSKTVDTDTIKFDGFSAKVDQNTNVDIMIKADLSDSFDAGKIRTALNTVVAIDTENSKEITDFSKPTGAEFTIAAADAELASSDNNPKSSLLEAGKSDTKIFAFRLTAKNDVVKVKDVKLTGTNLSKMTNYRLTNASNQVVAYSSVANDTAVEFISVASDDTAVAMDKSTTFYVIADANSNVNSAVRLNLSEIKITGTNGLDKVVTQTVNGNEHYVAENVLVVAKSANSNKSLSTSAMVFTVTASGKNEVKISDFNITRITSGYSLNGGAEGTIKVYKDSFNSSNLVDTANNENNTVDAGSTVTFIVVVDGAVKDSQANNTSYEIQLRDIDTVELTDGVAKYLNVGSFPFVETINN